MSAGGRTQLAWYGRALYGAGAALTLTTGLGLWIAPVTVGESFAWQIRSPLTAAFMGAWYTAAGIVLAAAAIRERYWARARIVLVVAFVLTTTSLIATIRFWDQFRLADGTGLERAIAWAWLVVYVVLPPAALIVFGLHERRGGRREWTVGRPLLVATRAVFAVICIGAAALGFWITISPGGLADVWPWPLPPLSASILGTWLLTVAAGCGWALLDRDWDRCRIVLTPFLVACALNLIAVIRFDADVDGGASTAVYLAVTAVCGLAIAGAGLAEERRRRVSAPPTG